MIVSDWALRNRWIHWLMPSSASPANTPAAIAAHRVYVSTSPSEGSVSR